jgi:hypothetical protein
LTEEAKPSGRGGKRPGAGRKPNVEPVDDIARVVEAIQAISIDKSSYGPLDRYREFRQVFGTDAGKRVLSQIIAMCEGPVLREHEVHDHAKIAYRQGMRFVSAQIFAWMQQPREAPDAAKKKG